MARQRKADPEKIKKRKCSFIISVYIDTNCVNARQNKPVLNQLEKLYQEEKILIETTDTFETELLEGKGYPQGLKKALNYVFSFGPGVIGHSRVGYCIVGSKEDDNRLGRVLEIIFGKKLRKDYSRNEIRDAMHIATTIRYGGTYFVTQDKTLLRKSENIRKEFQTLIVNPEDCLKLIKDRLKKTGTFDYE